MRRLLLALWVSLSLAAWSQPDPILAGVKRIGNPGVPGPLCVFGDKARVLLAATSEGALRPFLACAPLGQGRLVAFPHDGYFAEVLDQLDTGTLLENCLSWCSHSKKPCVGVHSLPQLSQRLKSRGYQVVELEGTGWCEGLDPRRVQVVVAVLMDPAIPPEDMRRLERYARQGGGLVSALTGWGYLQLYQGKNLTRDLPANQLFAKAGIAWDDGTFAVPLEVKKPTSLYLHAGRALQALSGGNALSPEDRKIASQTLARVFHCVPESALGAFQDYARGPQPRGPVKQEDSRSRAIITRKLAQQRQTPPQAMKADPESTTFPGSVPAGAARVRREVVIDPHVPGWHSCGLYAAPGEAITVRLPSAKPDWHVQIGSHSDTLWHLAEWQRTPELVWRFPLASPLIHAANPYGGLVYLDVPTGASGPPVKVEIDHAVPAPLYVVGQTSPEEWRRCRTSSAPWGELASSKLILTVPAAALTALEQPQELMRLWDSVMDAMADLTGRPRERQRPERIVFDKQISAGYMHSGYPIMAPLNEAYQAVNLARLKKEANWGLFHEIGHNHQEGDWTFKGTGEVTNNVLVLYAYHIVTPKASPISAASRAERHKLRERHLKAGKSFQMWQEEPFLALQMYQEIAEGLGWEVYRKAFASYRQLSAAERPQTDEQKRDRWLIQISRASGRNLGPFFENWGVPTSKAARDSLKDLPPWSPR